ncbi:unnamed protein product [Lampetra fluviatilis]
MCYVPSIRIPFVGPLGYSTRTPISRACRGGEQSGLDIAPTCDKSTRSVLRAGPLGEKLRAGSTRQVVGGRQRRCSGGRSLERTQLVEGGSRGRLLHAGGHAEKNRAATRVSIHPGIDGETGGVGDDEMERRGYGGTVRGEGERLKTRAAPGGCAPGQEVGPKEEEGDARRAADPGEPAQERERDLYI